MKRSGKEKILWFNMVALMWAFVIVGILFVAVPDGVAAFTTALGRRFGDFAEPPRTGFLLWLSLGTAYMVLVSALAYLIQKDLHGNRRLLPLLALGKLTSSLTSLLFYVFALDAFAYLLNFIVDGAIVLNLAGIYFSLGTPGGGSVFESNEAKYPRFRKGTRAREILAAVLAVLLPDPPRVGNADGVTHREIDEDRLDERLVDYFGELSPRGPLLLLVSLYLIEYGTFLWRGTPRPFTRLSAKEREDYLGSFERSRCYLRQRILFSIRFPATVLFFSQPHRETGAGYEFSRLDRSNVGEY
ncbi:MAG: hypothetical protein IT572_06185 [Deltaproteobacteria bacterium]|nr:hypothetical protein [Deltaproteobacteria bacterium]